MNHDATGVAALKPTAPIVGDIFDAVCERIALGAAQIRRIDDNITGWRFLYTARETLTENNGLMVAGINPGGEADMSDRGFSADGKNAYRTEKWDGPKYQREMVEFLNEVYKFLGVSENGLESAFDRTLATNFVPFRSAQFSTLSPETQALARHFARALWTDVLPLTNVRAILCCGQETYDGFKEVRSRCDTGRDLQLVPMVHASSQAWNRKQSVQWATAALSRTGFTLG